MAWTLVYTEPHPEHHLKQGDNPQEAFLYKAGQEQKYPPYKGELPTKSSFCFLPHPHWTQN